MEYEFSSYKVNAKKTQIMQSMTYEYYGYNLFGKIMLGDEEGVLAIYAINPIHQIISETYINNKYLEIKDLGHYNEEIIIDGIRCLFYGYGAVYLWTEGQEYLIQMSSEAISYSLTLDDFILIVEPAIINRYKK